jgi:hypothetical protein
VYSVRYGDVYVSPIMLMLLWSTAHNMSCVKLWQCMPHIRTCTHVRHKRPTAFKSTSKTKAADACDRLFFVRAPRLGDMDGHWDHYWIQCSLFISALTAFVGIFQIIDKPYTAQVRMQPQSMQHTPLMAWSGWGPYINVYLYMNGWT